MSHPAEARNELETKLLDAQNGRITSDELLDPRQARRERRTSSEPPQASVGQRFDPLLESGRHPEAAVGVEDDAGDARRRLDQRAALLRAEHHHRR